MSNKFQEAAINTNHQQRQAFGEHEAHADLGYQYDPHEFIREGMQDSEPEPELIEGLPAPDALTPADRYLELFEHVQTSRILPTAKRFRTARLNSIRWIF